MPQLLLEVCPASADLLVCVAMGHSPMDARQLRISVSNGQPFTRLSTPTTLSGRLENLALLCDLFRHHAMCGKASKPPAFACHRSLISRRVSRCSSRRVRFLTPRLPSCTSSLNGGSNLHSGSLALARRFRFRLKAPFSFTLRFGYAG